MMPTKVADACAYGAVCLFGVSLATIDVIVQIAAGLLAATAAAVSLYGKWTRRKSRRDRYWH